MESFLSHPQQLWLLMGLFTRLVVLLPLGAIGMRGESGMQNRASGEEDGLNRNINITVTSRVLFWIPESEWRYFDIIEWQEVTVDKLITQDIWYVKCLHLKIYSFVIKILLQTANLRTNENRPFTGKDEYQWDPEFSPLCFHHLGDELNKLLKLLMPQIPHL